MSIGDVNSAERGSGARFNDGKIDLTLLPPWCWEELSHRVDPDNLLRLFYGTELEHLIRFWEGDDDSIEIVIDGLSDDDITGAAEVFAYGAKKYAAWNWAKGMPWSVPMACYLRHMLLADPESVDAESGMPHRWHASCNLIMLAQFAQLCPDMDDRPQEIRAEFHRPGEDATVVPLPVEFILMDLPTPDLNNLIEELVEEQESRERTLRATGELRWNY